jgi:hypothetical protein
VTESTFVSDLQARIQVAERLIADQNENLAALRHLLRKEIGDSAPNGSTSAPVTAPTVSEPRTLADVDFTWTQADIVLALVQRSGEHGTRPRDIAEILVQHKLITKGSNAVYSHLSELKKKGRVQQKAEGLYVASSRPTAAKPLALAAIPAEKAQKKRTMSLEAREAIRKAQKARWAAVKKAKG